MKVPSHQCNSTLPSSSPSNSYMYFSELTQTKVDTFCDSINGNFNHCNSWAHVSIGAEADASSSCVLLDLDDEHSKDELSASGNLNGEKNFKKTKSIKHVHVPHSQKPPQLVAKRNLRERNRVQAVNIAFTRLRKAVPFQHARGKRISKVKTLQNAINYIRALEELLENNFYSTPTTDIFNSKQDSFWWDFDY